ncbi:MAG: PTS sugar transporter subunit IIA [Deltaproteobacteria bacterium]|nr:PTS sugar transporter subunit IIA [Deltaproteobacteria bacterium]
MQLSHYMTPQSIVVPLAGTTKDQVLKELVEELARRKNIPDAGRLLASIKDREDSASTFLPMGVAVPHARVAVVDEMTMITGVAPAGVQDDPKQSPLTARIFCLFLSPTAEKEFGKHLKLLARIAAVFSDPKLVDDIAVLTTPHDIFARIQKRERQIDKE